jgi:SAM-dependent methyltransferase
MGRTSFRSMASSALSLLPERPRAVVHQLLRKMHSSTREVVAARHLHGDGIEIGAMHYPLRVPAGARVRYVDQVSADVNLDRFSEIRHLQLVQPDFVEDGFKLPSFSRESVDFLIANHVLEHSSDVLGTLDRWSEVIRPGGALYLSVPLAERCFDRGRPITTIEHFVADWNHLRAGDVAAFRQATREHYVEWLSISLPAVVSEQGGQLGPENERAMKMTPDALLAEDAEIHFHTFSLASYEQLLRHFCTDHHPEFRLVDLVENGIEAIAVVKRD